jgi:hypothetical protein
MRGTGKIGVSETQEADISRSDQVGTGLYRSVARSARAVVLQEWLNTGKVLDSFPSQV